MTALDFLSQAYRLDLRIDSKLEQIASLNELATKCTSTITGMPRNPSHSLSSMADAVAKIVDLQTEIDADIHRLVDIKRQIVTAIKAVDNKEYQTLLELRFLCGCTWEEVAAKMGVSQKRISDLENGSIDVMQVETLRRYITSLGGTLEITAKLPGVSLELQGLGTDHPLFKQEACALAAG